MQREMNRELQVYILTKDKIDSFFFPGTKALEIDLILIQKTQAEKEIS